MRMFEQTGRGARSSGAVVSAREAHATLQPAPFGPAGPWVAYFRNNLAARRAIIWNDNHGLTAEERRAIGRSIAKFQLGENSDGRFLQHHADLHAQKSGDHSYSYACRLFIREEQRHAAELGRFMDDCGLAKRSRDWTDTIFRYVRKLGGLDLAISVLLTAELIALVYYQALARATGSLTLRSICAEILRDERAHVVFQAGTLGRLRVGGPPWRNAWRVRLQRAFFCGVVFLVWFDHGRVLKAGGFGRRRYWYACWSAFRSIESLLIPAKPRRAGADPA